MNVTSNTRWALIVFAAGLFCSCGNAPSSQTTSAQQSTEISILLWDSLLAAHPDAILLDVRSDEEWEAGHLANASYVSFDWDHRKEPLSKIPWDRPVYVYCEAGGRSGVVTEELRIIGHPHIVDLIGGMERWMENEKPLDFGLPVPLAQKED
jgi:rhodanese-related sulfurtransferase